MYDLVNGYLCFIVRDYWPQAVPNVFTNKGLRDMKYLYAGLLMLMLVFADAASAQEPIDIDSILALANDAQTEEALAKLDGLLANEPHDIQALFLKGLLLLEHNDTVGARETFSEIARLYPRLPEAFNNLAAIYASEGEYEKARNALLSAIANAPDYSTVRNNLGDLYVKMAADAYQKALDLNPEDPASEAKLKHLEQMFDGG